MKILSLHCDYIKFRAVEEAIKEAEETSKQESIAKECLVVFSAIEKRDEGFEDEIAKKFAENVLEICEKVKCKKVVIYPYVHLTSEPSKASSAKKVLENAEKILSKKVQVTRAPFGWYKEFELKCKGHPLAE
ncbi:MAG: threonyl-tRNA synthetase editing domain-containing protein, partial [Candidatus Pacearchaeota archaeon]